MCSFFGQSIGVVSNFDYIHYNSNSDKWMFLKWFNVDKPIKTPPLSRSLFYEYFLVIFVTVFGLVGNL